MHSLLDHELERDVEQSQSGGDREISLGAGTILGIFFGLALVCGAVFGLGYSFGRRTAQNSPQPVIAAIPAPLTSVSKPAAGFGVPRAAQAEAPEPGSPEVPPATKSSPADGMIVGDRFPSKLAPATSTQPAAVAGAVPTASATGNFMVQVAAVSTQDIADIELAALKKYNYPVAVRHEPQDQLLHIQIGPFATKKDAEAMRQNVLSHGFNAIVK